MIFVVISLTIYFKLQDKVYFKLLNHLITKKGY